MPIMIAAAAFEQVWKMAESAMKTTINLLISSAISILKISLKITIIYAIVYFAADQVYPGPEDGFTTILPPLLGQIGHENADAKTMSVMNAFKKKKKVSLSDGQMDKDKFVSCFKTQRSMIEARYPGAFDFMDDGFDFLLFMIGIWFLYFWVISPKVDELLGTDKETKETFDYGQWVKDFGKTVYNAPVNVYTKVRDKIKENK